MNYEKQCQYQKLFGHRPFSEEVFDHRPVSEQLIGQ